MCLHKSRCVSIKDTQMRDVSPQVQVCQHQRHTDARCVSTSLGVSASKTHRCEMCLHKS
ncbi:hypothetical protein BgiMline_003678, partial [Biomphalaria glabrata]